MYDEYPSVATFSETDLAIHARLGIAGTAQQPIYCSVRKHLAKYGMLARYRTHMAAYSITFAGAYNLIMNEA
jgi:hypothetical protein